MTKEHDPAPDNELIGGKYRLGEVLGEGGVGTVYRAVHIWTEREVAIKILDPALPEEQYFRRAFLREARAATALKHPNVVEILDMGGVAEGGMYLVMELLDGPTLRDVLQDQERLTAAETFEVLLPVMDALEAAHTRGILHRDVKPENIILSLDVDSKLVPKLLDFGVAQLTEGRRADEDDDDTFTGGTPAYMSPERSAGEPGKLGPETDVWGVAIVWYECLTGAPPFDGETPAEVLENVCSAPVSFDGIPDSHAAVLRQALQRDPALRTKSIRELKAGIQRFGIRPPEEAALAERRSSRPTLQSRADIKPTLYGLSPVWMRPLPVDAAIPETEIPEEPPAELAEPQPTSRVEDPPMLPKRKRRGLPLLLVAAFAGAVAFLVAPSNVVELRPDPRRDQDLVQLTGSYGPREGDSREAMKPDVEAPALEPDLEAFEAPQGLDAALSTDDEVEPTEGDLGFAEADSEESPPEEAQADLSTPMAPAEPEPPPPDEERPSLDVEEPQLHSAGPEGPTLTTPDAPDTDAPIAPAKPEGTKQARSPKRPRPSQKKRARPPTARKGPPRLVTEW